MFRTTTLNALPSARLRTWLCTAFGLCCLLGPACEPITPSTLPATTVSLQSGMGLIEAAGALGCQGAHEASGMRTRDRHRDWNVEWRIGRVYELENERIIAIYAAWGSGTTGGAPPSSAYRLVDWRRSGDLERRTIDLWTLDA